MCLPPLEFGFVFGFVGSLDSLFVNDKVFDADDFTITLTTQFSYGFEDGVYYFGSKDCSIAVMSFDFVEYPDIAQMSELELLNRLKSLGAFSASSDLKNLEGLFIVEEQAMSDAGDVRTYFTVFKKSDNAYLLFEFGCDNENYQDYRYNFIDWAKTIVVK